MRHQSFSTHFAPSLYAWRRLKPYELDRIRPDLRNYLLERTAFDAEPNRCLLTEAAKGNAAAQLAVADVLGDDLNDLSWSWATMAALGGDLAAQLSVVAALSRLLRDDDAPAMCRNGAARALEGWTSKIAGKYAALGPDRTTALSKLSLAGLSSNVRPAPAIEVETAPLPPPPSPRKVTYGSWLTVARHIHVIKGNAEERAFVESWSRLQESLPLKACEIPISMARSILEGEFPWMMDAIKALFGDMSLRYQSGNLWIRFRPTLLVGPPGNGKTRFAKRLAQVLGIGYGELAAAGASDNRILAGTARGWSNPNPSFVLHVIRSSASANPLILVDELDKAGGSSRHGDIKQTLLSMLEPITAKAWPDEALLSPVDLSQVNWLATANRIDGLKGPLLTRLRLIHTDLPQPEHAELLLQVTLREVAEDLGIRSADLPAIDTRLLGMIKRSLKNGIGIRRIRAAVEASLVQTCESSPQWVVH